MVLCQNNSETMESIKEAKATCTHSIQEAEDCCSVAIREAEAQRVSQAVSLQQSHHKTVQHLEEESIEEERKGQLNFLSTCQTALWVSPPEFLGMLVASYHVLLGHSPMSRLFSIPQGAHPFHQGLPPGLLPHPMPEHSSRPKQWCHSPDLMDTSPLSGAMSQATAKGPSTSKWWMIMPLHKTLTRSHLEAFSWDSSLVNETREEYFWLHHPNLNHENTCDFSEVFWCMTKTADLFGSAIFEITNAWLGQDELRQANYSIMTLWKGLKFFRVVSPSESPKVMGLMGIHDPDALQCFNGVTHCPWCRKVGQNKGTIINHLRTVHYKLGLMCKNCFGWPSISWEAICHHSWKNCIPSGEGGLDESSSLA